jgi:hypothetical protein
LNGVDRTCSGHRLGRKDQVGQRAHLDLGAHHDFQAGDRAFGHPAAVSRDEALGPGTRVGLAVDGVHRAGQRAEVGRVLGAMAGDPGVADRGAGHAGRDHQQAERQDKDGRRSTVAVALAGSLRSAHGPTDSGSRAATADPSTVMTGR